MNRIYLQLKHYQVTIFFAFVVVVVLSVPVLFGLFLSDDEYVYTWLSYFAQGDYLIYWNYIWQGFQGNFLLENYFTSEAYFAGYFFPFWSIVSFFGFLVASSEILFFISKILGAIFLVGMLGFLLRWVFDSWKDRFLAFFLILFGGGIGVVVLPFMQNVLDVGVDFPADLIVYEGFGYGVLMHSGLFSVSVGLVVSIVYLYLRSFELIRYRALFVVAVFCLGFFHGYALIWLTIALLVDVFIQLLRRNYISWVYVLLYAIAVVPAGVWYVYSFFRVELFQQWIVQNRVEMVSFRSFLLGFGLFLLFGLIGVQYASMKSSRIVQFLLIWIFVAVGLAFVDMGFSRKMLEGVFVPLGILSVFGIRHAYGLLLKIQRTIFPQLFVGFVFISFVVSFLFVFLSEIYSLQQYEYPYFVSTEERALLNEVSVSVSDAEVVLASPLISQFVPGVSYRRVYFADPHQTFDYTRKRDEVFGLFYEDTSSDEWLEFLDSHEIDYILFSDNDRVLGGKIFEDDLHVIFENEAGVLYAVNE